MRRFYIYKGDGSFSLTDDNSTQWLTEGEVLIHRFEVSDWIEAQEYYEIYMTNYTLIRDNELIVS